MATKTSYEVTLLVIDAKSKRGIPGLKAEAWDKDLIYDDLLGSVVTDKDGKAVFSFDKKYFAELFLDQKPDLYFKLFSGEKLVFSTEKTTLWNVSSRTRTVTVEIPAVEKLPPADTSLPATGTYVISGNVIGMDGAPLGGKRLVAVDVDLKGAAKYRTAATLSEISGDGFEFLGEAVSDARGFYSITFEYALYSKGERDKADAIVYAVEEERLTGRSRLLVASDYAGDGKAEGLFVLVSKAAGAGSEYAQLMQKLQPFLEESKVALTELAASIDQVEFAAAELRVNPLYVQLAADAEAIRTKHASLNLSHELLHAIGRQQIQLSWIVLYRKKDDELRAAILRSIEAGMISTYTAAQIDAFLAQLHTGAAENSLDHVSTTSPATLDQLLKHALPEREQRLAFVDASRSFTGTDYSKFWSEHLPAVEVFKNNPELIDSLLLNQQLTLISGNHSPLIAELQGEREITSMEQLLALQPAEWLSIIGTTGVPAFIKAPNESDRPKIYAEQIQNVLNAAFPTQKIKLMLERGELTIENGAVSNGVGEFLNLEKEFDFSKSRVHAFTTKTGTTEVEYYAPEVINEVKRIQRVFQVSSKPEGMAVLLSNKLDSAHAITSMPKDSFVEMYSEAFGGKLETEAVYQRAMYMSTRANEHAMKIMDTARGRAPAFVMTDDELLDVEETLQDHIPDYAELFGSPDICECEHCRSVFSAAAYFVDLLRFLWRGAKNEATPKPKSPLELFELRRPDLLHLPLTCENTNTVIPYVDLVNEVMEYYTYHGTLNSGAAYDTGSTTAAELRANPQNFEPEAYRILKDTVYPFSLPYHQPLDVIRTYARHLGTSRAEVIKTMQPAVPSPAAAKALDAESLSISNEEFTILTGKDFSGNSETTALHEYFGYTAIGQLERMAGTGVDDGIHEFLRRSGMRYTELVDLLKTKFVNPHHAVLEYLEQLFADSPLNASEIYDRLKAIDGGTLIPENDPQIMAVLSPAISSDDFIAWVKKHFVPFNSILTLYQKDSACDLDTTYLRKLGNVYADDNSSGITAPEWSAMHRFIRLWKKLGWTIHETDLLLEALGETNVTASAIHHLSSVAALNKELKLPLNQLATLWGNIETYGDRSLYKKLFLNKAVQRIDASFQPDKFGNYLTDTTQLLKDHVPGILAAFRMSQEDLNEVYKVARVTDNNAPRKIDPENDKLTLFNLSTIYRHVMLAKALKLKVADCCRLLTLFGIKPFSSWDIQQKKFVAIQPSDAQDFCALAASLKKANFKPDQLHYIFNGELPAGSKLGIDAEKAMQTARAIHEAFVSIAQNYPDVPAAPLTAELVKNELLLSFSAEIVNQFMSFISERQTFKLETTTGLVIAIPPALTAKYSYTPATGLLRCKGIMTEEERVALKPLSSNEEYQAAIDQLHAVTNEYIQASQSYRVVTTPGLGDTLIPSSLALKYTYINATGRLICKGIMSDDEVMQLKSLTMDVPFAKAVDALYALPGNFIKENFKGVFLNMPQALGVLINHPHQAEEADLDTRLKLVYDMYLPLLRKKLREDNITQHIASLIGLSEEETAILIQPDLDALTGDLAKKGMTARYFDDAAGLDYKFARTDETIDFNWLAGSPDAAIDPDSFRVDWHAYLIPPSSGDYWLVVDVKEADEVFNLYLDDTKLIGKSAMDSQLTWEIPATLNATKMHKLKLEYIEATGNAGVSLSWKTATTAETIISSSLPTKEIDAFVATAITYHRAAKFIQGFKLTAREIAHLIKYKVNFGNIEFKTITAPNWQRVNAYVQLRNSVPQTQAALIDVFEMANRTNPAPDVKSLITLLHLATDWDTWDNDKQKYPDLDHLVNIQFAFNVNSFKNEIALLRLSEIFQLTRRIGVSAKTLASWGMPETGFDNLNKTAQVVKSTVKAKYEEEDWLSLAGGLSDKIRENQKQALISHLLTKQTLIDWGVRDADGLFEYFLIDVQMDSCMDTSRIVQANASVQMFVNRCLLNLESRRKTGAELGVSPKAIDTQRWEWMKYYRVWEANRKVFIYPENWLEPEWRDDRSPFFKELESELVQNDITTRSVESAFRNYLTKLNDVAHLNVCGNYSEKDGSGKLKLLHVVARNNNAPYHYYYRTWNPLGKWTAWENMEVDIRGVEAGIQSGSHVMPVVWKNRLFVFWPEFIEKMRNVDMKKDGVDASIKQISEMTPGSIKPEKYWEVRLAWTERVDDKWSPKQLTKESVEIVATNTTPYPGSLMFKSEIDTWGYLVIKPFSHNYSTGWVGHPYFRFVDMESQMLTDYSSGSTPPKYASANGYVNFFEKNYSTAFLEYWGNRYFQTDVIHTVLFSNDTLEKEEAPDDPFFFNDAHRAYFIRPFETSITVVVQDPTIFPPPIFDYVDDSWYTKPHFPGVGPDDYMPGPEDYMPGLEAVLPGENSFSNPATGAFGNILGGNFANGGPSGVQAAHFAMSAKKGMNKGMNLVQPSFAMGAESMPGTVTAQPMFLRSNINANTDSDSTATPMAYKMSGGNEMIDYVSIGGAFSGTIARADYRNGLSVSREEVVKTKGLEFHTFYHPYSSDFVTNLNRKGIDGLMESDTTIHGDNGTTFEHAYLPDFAVVKKAVPDDYLPGAAYTYYKENVCFDVYGANSIYNWELFFHAPLYIATRLSKNGKYEEAMKWFHYIFDPTTSELPLVGQSETSRYWKTFPFKFTPAEKLEDWFRNLGPNTDASTENASIAEWRKNPFKPHLIARNRPLAYMKNVVLKYVDNLVAWGDSLFRMDTMETVNEALQLYVIANHILGPRPQFVPQRGTVKAETYFSLKDKWDDFSNALVELENLFPYSSKVPVGDTGSGPSLLGVGKALYFGIPSNEKLLESWDTVTDRLFKIRHCMDISGAERKLALFAPAIDPGMLINAAAQGLSLGSILADLSSPAPIYRFSYMLQRANDFCNDVKSLGNSLLGVLEKKDGEELGRLRATHETAMLELITAVKERQVLEARSNRDGLLKNRETAKFRLDHYTELLGNATITLPAAPTVAAEINSESSLPGDTTLPVLVPDVDESLVDTDESGVKIIPKEKEDLDKAEKAMVRQQVATGMEGLAAVLHVIPQIGAAATPIGVGLKVGFGGQQLGSMASGLAKIPQILGAVYAFEAAQAAKMASFIRREQDWTLQANLAAREIVHLDKQLTSAEIRLQVTEKELENHKKQIEHAKETQQFLCDKFTNQELYQWMKEQLFAVYKQAYNMAYDMAKKVEKCYRYETGNEITSFIQYGYWDNTHQGLCAGEKLHLALRQLEKSYFEENKRELEMSRSISVALLNPLALQQLKSTGKCTLSLPEELFDMDYQGHYFRRIKTVSLSIPCIAGPYTTVSCTLRLMKNTIRINTSMNEGGGYEHANDEGIWIDDDRFRSSNVPVKAITTSTGQRDTGMFEMNFRDDRYLPFEGAGAISEWKIELTADPELRQFDYSTISDVIMHVSYTARENGGLFRENATSYIKSYLSNPDLPPLLRMFSLKHEFSTEWYRFLHPAVMGGDQVFSMTLTRDHFPFFTRERSLNVQKIDVLIQSKKSGNYFLTFSATDLSTDPMTTAELTAGENATYGNMQKATIKDAPPGFNLVDMDVFAPISLKLGRVTNTYNALETNPDELEDVFVVFHYGLGVA